MVRSIKIFSLLLLLFMGWSCNDDDDDDMPTPQPSLDAPTGVATSNVTASGFDVSWNAVADADSYTLQVSTDNGFGSFVLNQSGVTGTSGSVSGLDAETAYFVRVSATNSEATSDFSAVVSVTTSAAPVTPPENPTTTEATVNGNAFAPSVSEGRTSSDGKTQLVFSDGSSTITLTTTASAAGTFSISANGDHTATFVMNDSVFIATSGSIEVTEYGETASGTYAFEAAYAFTNSRVMNNVSITGGSFAGITLAAAQAIAAPTVGDVTDITETGFTANWSAVAGAIAYLVDVASDDSFTSLIVASEEVQGTSLAVEGLEAGTDYFIRVRASDGLTTSENSATGTVATSGSSEPEPTELEAPVASAATDITETSFTANWSAVSGATEYIIEVASDNAFTSFVLTDETTTTSYTVTGLDAETNYYFRVRATDGTTTSENSNSVTATTTAGNTNPGGGGSGEYVTRTTGTNSDGEATETIFTYDNSCRLIKIEGIQGDIYTSDFTYNSNGLVSEINTVTQTSAGTITGRLEYKSYTADGKPIEVELDEGDGSGLVTVTYNYDNAGKVEDVTLNAAGQDILYTYTYTGNNVTRVVGTFPAFGLTLSTSDYTYTTEGTNHYRLSIERGYFPFALQVPLAFSEDLIASETTTDSQGNVTTTTYDYEFGNGDLQTRQTITITNTEGTTVSETFSTYSANCN